MDLAGVDLYSTSPEPEALPGMRVVSYAGTQHLQCPLDPLDPSRSLADWTADAASLGEGFRGHTSRAPDSLDNAVTWLNVAAVVRLLKGQAHLPPHLAQTMSATLLQKPLTGAAGGNLLTVAQEALTFHPMAYQRTIVGLLLAQGARPTLATLNEAAANANPAILHRLLDVAPAGGWDFTGDDARRSGTPLHALRTNHWSTAPETVDLLVDAGVPIDQPIDDAGLTPLVEAVRGKAWLVVRRLLERGADPNRAPDGIAPLHWAAQGDDVRSIALLLAAGADSSPRMVNGNTPMNEAARRGSVRALQDFLDRGFDPLSDRDETFPHGRSLRLAQKLARDSINPAAARNAQACVALLEGWALGREVDGVTPPGVVAGARRRL